MKQKLTKIIGHIKLERLKNDKRIIIFAVCLLIATVLWFLNALEKDYTSSLTYTIKYVNPPKKLFLANTPPSKFELNVEARGYTLLRYKLTFPFSPIEIDLSAASQNMEQDRKTMVIPTTNLIRQIDNQVSNEISILDVSPENITLDFDSIRTKIIPVLPQVKLNFRSQYYLRGVISVKPESIKISGPASIIDTIQFLHTETEIFQDLDKNIEKAVSLQQPSKTNLSVDRVTLHIPVDKYTEKTVTVPVHVIHQPEGSKMKLFPPQVSVSFMVGLNDYENISAADFSVVVDYEQALEGDTVLEVSLESQPRFIHLLKVNPGSVEYLIESD